MELRIAGLVPESLVDGPGIRFVVFCQGCQHYCPDCHNQHTWDINGGKLADADEIVKMVLAAKLIRGVTFSGGEPFLQPSPLTHIAKKVKEKHLDIIAYTGYTWEELVGSDSEERKGLLKEIDFLIDGRYDKDKRSTILPYRGSSNQRIINVKMSLQTGKPVEEAF